ncbi:MAG: hypothetical protein ACK4GL_04265 [Flavobacteriales bacterium]
MQLLRFINLGLWVIAFMGSTLVSAQQVLSDCNPVYLSKNGWHLPTEGTLRVLIVYCEIKYENPEEDPTKGGNETWPAGKLPIWANELADPHPPSSAFAAKGLTNYFLHASSGKLIILGDYLKHPIDGQIFSASKFDIRELVNNINEALGSRIITQSGLNDIQHFDNWTLGTPETGPGLPKISPSTEIPSKYDHVMFIWRNRKGADNTGASYNSGFGTKLLGHDANSYSINTTYRDLPFKLIRHEFSHLILGGNNFHCGGGGHAAPGYFPHLMGGWSILGLHDSSLQTWNAWDRQRLGWKTTDSEFEITARNESNTKFVNGDLDALNVAQEGIYILRDFATHGDAIRIKLPNPEAEQSFAQFLWLEFHQGHRKNGIDYDRWQYEHPELTCVSPMISGMMAYMQIDRENRYGCRSQDVFGGHADYLRPMPAHGFWDRMVSNFDEMNDCVQYDYTKPFKLIAPNPLSGSSDLDRLIDDLNSNGKIEFNELSSLFNYVQQTGMGFKKNLFALGHSRHVFTQKTSKRISISTNPSSANMLTMVRNTDSSVKGAKNNRTVYLNGISVTIIEQQADFIKLDIRFADYQIDQNARWCADKIVLQAYDSLSNVELIISKGKTLQIDRSLSNKRLDNPEVINGKPYFNSATHFVVKSGNAIRLQNKSKLIVDNGSTLELELGASIILEGKSKIILRNGGQLRLPKEECIKFNSRKARLIKK